MLEPIDGGETTPGPCAQTAIPVPRIMSSDGWGVRKETVGKSLAMYFEMIGEIGNVEIIAKGVSVRDRQRLTTQFGPGRWRKLKGTARVRLRTGDLRRVELHWYEAHGIGRRKFKIKYFLD